LGFNLFALGNVAVADSASPVTALIKNRQTAVIDPASFTLASDDAEIQVGLSLVKRRGITALVLFECRAIIRMDNGA